MTSKNSITTFEDNFKLIENEVEKWRPLWKLSSVPKLSFDDIKSEILCRIHEKFGQWDQKRDIRPWLYRIISNAWKNKLRDEYYSYAKPCLKCPAYIGADYKDGESLCKVYGHCGCECPIYKHWNNNKRAKHEIELATSLGHGSGVEKQLFEEGAFLDYEKAIKGLSALMKERLKEKEYQVFLWLYLEKKDESWVSEKLEFITTEKNRNSGYRQIKNIKNKIEETAYKIMKTHSIQDLL